MLLSSNVLLLSAAFGSGHMGAARAVAQACRDLAPGCTAEAINLSHPVLNAVAAGYLQLLRMAPFAYRQLYNHCQGGFSRSLIHLSLARAVRREIDQTNPAAVVATHPFPGGVAARLRRRGELTVPLAMVLTDFVPHPLWVHEGVDRYFVASEEAADRLMGLGVERGRIAVTGIPIRPGFEPGDRPGQRQVRHVLVMGGGLGLGPIAAAVESLAALDRSDLRVAVVCGTNEELREELSARYPGFTIFGQTDQVPDLMSRADLLITKPGGLSCSEALASGLPLLLLEPLPGHEEENAAYLAQTGAALPVAAKGVGQAVQQLLFGGSGPLKAMQSAAGRAGRPQAAQLIAAQIIAGGTR